MGRLSAEEYGKLAARFLELTAMLEVPAALGNLSVAESPLEDYVETEQGLLLPKGEPHILKIHEQPIMSWNRNNSNILACQFLGINTTGTATFGDGHINVKDQGGTLRGSTSFGLSWQGYMGHRAAKNDDAMGIVVGTGSTGETFADFAMDAKIADGNAPGELFYFAQFKPTIVWSSGDRTWTITHERYFKNNDGSSITINEVGLIEYMYATISQYYILTLRDKLSSGVAIAAGKVARVTIEFETAAFPS